MRRSVRFRPETWVLWVASTWLIGFWVVLGDRYSLWFDEAFSVALSQMSPHALAQQLFEREANHGPYYIALWLWEKVFPGAFMARGVSALGSVVAVTGIWTVVRRRTEPMLATVVVLVFAVNPFVLGWTLQARAYTWVMAGTIWAVHTADSLHRTGERRYVIRLGVIIGLSVATLLTSVFVHGAILLSLFIDTPRGRRRRDIVVSGGVSLVVFAPFARAFLLNRGQIGWIPELTLRRFAAEVVQGIGGPPTAILVALGIGLVFKSFVSTSESRQFIAALGIAAFSTFGILVVSWVVQPMYDSRYFAPSVPLVVIAAVGGYWYGMVSIRKVLIPLVVVASAVLTALWGSNALPPRADFRWATHIVETHIRAGDGIVTIPTYDQVTFRYNSSDTSGEYPFVVVGPEQDMAMVDSDDRAVVPRRLWLIESNREGTTDQFEKIRAFLERTYPVELERFERGSLVVTVLGR